MQTRKHTHKQNHNHAPVDKADAAPPAGPPTEDDIKVVTLDCGTAAVKSTGVIKKEGDTPIITGTGK